MSIPILAALALFPAMAGGWWLQRRANNAGWVDVIWTFSLGIAGVVAVLASGQGERAWLVAALVAAWALRLGLYILGRTRTGPEDARYNNFRREWGAAFQQRMFGFLMIQAAAAALLLLPMVLAASSPRPLGWPDALAVLVMVVAVVGEGIADRQLGVFRADPANHGKVCDIGLWSWSRHPNYFFEWLHWLAYPLFALGADYDWLALLGPAFMYWLLVYVSGIPPLEAQMLRSRGDAYRAYQRRVSAFIPLPSGNQP
jgi:steroid 5-alpha reductase family enzyme